MAAIVGSDPQETDIVAADGNADALREQLKETKSQLSKAKRLKGLIEKAILAVEGYSLSYRGEFQEAHQKLKKATGEDNSWLAELEYLGGDYESGLKNLRKQVERRPGEVIPRARLAYVLWLDRERTVSVGPADAEPEIDTCGAAADGAVVEADTDAAETAEADTAVDSMRAAFEELRATSSSIDLHIPLFSRLRPLAEHLGYDGANWLKPAGPLADVGFRPPLDSLGPFRWQPSAAPSWQATDSDGKPTGSREFQGRPHIVIFYLGHGCLHCAEQLQEFGPRAQDFADEGIDMIAISSDGQEGLMQSVQNYGGAMPIRLASNENLDIFRKFRAFDDFENVPLHGTFLIDGEGKVLWQDISYEPFMEPQFLLDESLRLLNSRRVSSGSKITAE